MKDEWNDLTSQIDTGAKNVKTLVKEGVRPKWIQNNAIELIINIVMIILLGIHIFTFDSADAMPDWTKYLLVISSILPLWPILNLYRRINYPDHSQSTLSFLKTLIRDINRYRTFQILYNSIYAFIVCFIIFIYLEVITANVEGVKYAGIINFPDEVKYKFMGYVAIGSFVISLMSAPMAIMFYQLFYAKTRKEAKLRLKELQEE